MVRIDCAGRGDSKRQKAEQGMGMASLTALISSIDYISNLIYCASDRSTYREKLFKTIIKKLFKINNI
jgi:hypothetical protein